MCYIDHVTNEMSGRIFLLVAVATFCDAALVPITNNRPSSTGCTREKRCSGLGIIPSSGGIDYNYLFNLLYPGTNYEPFDEVTIGLLDTYSYLGNGCDGSNCCKLQSPEMRRCGRCPSANCETGYDDCRCCGDCRGCVDCRCCGDGRGCGTCRGCCDCRDCCNCRNCGDFACAGYGKCTGICRSGSGYGSRCGSYGQRTGMCSPCRGRKLTPQYCSGQITCP